MKFESGANLRRNRRLVKKKRAIEQIEYEMTTFVRLATYLDHTDKKVGVFERAAYLLLRELDQLGPARLKTLADALKLDISTVSRQAASLESKGLIERFADPSDGRATLFHITETGKEKLAIDKKIQLSRYHQWLEDWTEEECEIFGKLLARLNNAFIQ
ncbi:MarR family transcriptional regulator [Geobacillus stearothermophilus]|uniref:MarR family winged helix-turn-helix transcriptional regulator n=1 Tax=Geobacillus stearothermophilus TaxID=1422 RepID=UPI002EA55947|nr:MarR family transcriptional regulator [Geobacillus stearothermophilus]